MKSEMFLSDLIVKEDLIPRKKVVLTIGDINEELLSINIEAMLDCIVFMGKEKFVSELLKVLKLN